MRSADVRVTNGSVRMCCVEPQLDTRPIARGAILTHTSDPEPSMPFPSRNIVNVDFPRITPAVPPLLEYSVKLHVPIHLMEEDFDSDVDIPSRWE